MTRTLQYGLAVSLSVHALLWMVLPASFWRRPNPTRSIKEVVIEIRIEQPEPVLARLDQDSNFLPANPQALTDLLFDRFNASTPLALRVPPPSETQDAVSATVAQALPVRAVSLETPKQPAEVSKPPAVPKASDESISITSESSVSRSEAENAGPISRPASSRPELSEAQAHPVCLKRAPPPYPARARRLCQEGVAILRVHLDDTGAIHDIKVARSSEFPLLDQAAVEAERKSRYEPARVAGRPAACVVEVPYQFKLK